MNEVGRSANFPLNFSAIPLKELSPSPLSNSRGKDTRPDEMAGEPGHPYLLKFKGMLAVDKPP